MASTITSYKKKPIILIVLLATLCVGIFGYGTFKHKKPNLEIEENTDYHTVKYNGEKYNYNSSIINILLLGIDSQDTTAKQGQADSIELLSIDRNNKVLNIINIPRDTMTDIKITNLAGDVIGWNTSHLNLAYGYGRTPQTGAMYTMQAVSKLLGNIPVNKYIAIDLNKLKDLHQLVGDLEVEVLNDSAIDVNPSWTTGNVVTITSENVETFLRTRDTSTHFSSVDRLMRQQGYINSYFTKFQTNLEKNIDETLKKCYDLYDNFITNITLDDLNSYMDILKKSDVCPDGIYTLPGKNQQGLNFDEYYLDEVAVNELVLDLFYKRK